MTQIIFCLLYDIPGIVCLYHVNNLYRNTFPPRNHRVISGIIQIIKVFSQKHANKI